MNNILPSYPNEYFKSKHERFKDLDICMCECDCDCIITMIQGLKKGDKCYLCQEDDHQYPVYIKKDRQWIDTNCGCCIMLWNTGEIQLIKVCHSHTMFCVKKALSEVIKHD